MSTVKATISLTVEVKASMEKVWDAWTDPQHITQWNFASSDWHCPKATNDLREKGQFNWRMESKDGSNGFDFKGTYKEIREKDFISYHLEDGRAVTLHFIDQGDSIKIVEAFEALGTESDKMQGQGWLAILGNFKAYVEA